MFYNLFNCNVISLAVPFIFSFVLSAIMVKYFIVLLKKHSKFQPIREEMVEDQQKKAKTPTMGGLPFTVSIVLNILLWCDLKNHYIWLFLFTILSFSLIGLADDVVKVFFSNTKGFQGAYKLVLQLIISSIGFFWMQSTVTFYNFSSIMIPGFGIVLCLGIAYLPLAVLCLTGASNAVNITDGLDGLLAISATIILTFFLIIIYLTYNGNIINPLLFIDNCDLMNIAKMIIIFIGSVLGFFVFNIHPAKIFMGDVGSLMLGAGLFLFAVFLKIELFYAIMAILFMIEIGSSMLQVGCYKLTQKRIFKMAPFHHHLEKCGWKETKILKVMWAFVFLCCLIALLLMFV